MESRDVPQWVAQTFVRSAIKVGATASREQLEACCDALICLWCAEGRYQHGIGHLLDLLNRIDTLAPETPNTEIVRLAAWFHGVVFSTADQAVYTRNGGEDEVKSAELARDKLTKLGVPQDVVERICALIVGLKLRAPERSAEGGTLTRDTSTMETLDMDLLALRDAHLGTLAVEPQRYRTYMKRVREEYAHIPLRHFIDARIRIVNRLLSRKHLYCSPLAAQWEVTARQNLINELARLEDEQSELLQCGNAAALTDQQAIDAGVPATGVTIDESSATAQARPATPSHEEEPAGASALESDTGHVSSAILRRLVNAKSSLETFDEDVEPPVTSTKIPAVAIKPGSTGVANAATLASAATPASASTPATAATAPSAATPASARTAATPASAPTPDEPYSALEVAPDY